MKRQNPMPLAIKFLLNMVFAILWIEAEAETIRQDFNTMTELSAFWDISTWGNDSRTHSAQNVSIQDGILSLKLSASPSGTKPVCAEIVSKRSNFRYGSYSASIKTSKTPGGVVGWFIYRDSPLNEVDVEMLTRENRNLYFTLHHVQTNVDSKVVKLNFDPTEAFHEYRFDWRPDRVDYFIDGNPAGTLTKQVPDSNAAIMLNHWSGNIAGWGGAAPTEDMSMEVDWMMYSSDFPTATAVFMAALPTWHDKRKRQIMTHKGQAFPTRIYSATPPVGVGQSPDFYSLKGEWQSEYFPKIP